MTLPPNRGNVILFLDWDLDQQNVSLCSLLLQKTFVPFTWSSGAGIRAIPLCLLLAAHIPLLLFLLFLTLESS